MQYKYDCNELKLYETFMRRATVFRKETANKIKRSLTNNRSLRVPITKLILLLQTLSNTKLLTLQVLCLQQGTSCKLQILCNKFL